MKASTLLRIVFGVMLCSLSCAVPVVAAYAYDQVELLRIGEGAPVVIPSVIATIGILVAGCVTICDGWPTD
jgi:ABC-type spermidine/putrescine transport system permease subunit II